MNQTMSILPSEEARTGRKKRSFSTSKRSIKQTTLNGLQTNLADHVGEDVQYWGGIRVQRESPNFSKYKDETSKWVEAYYNGQYFKVPARK